MHKALLLLIFLCFFGLAFLLAPNYQVGIFSDDALYINLAHAVATGQGYVDPSEVEIRPHTFVPPLYPLLLVPFITNVDYEWLVNTNFFLIQFISICLVFLSLCLYYLFLLRMKYTYALLLTALLALNPRILWGIAIWPYSDALYIFLSMLSLFSLAIWKEQRSLRWLVLTIISASLASLTRLVGITLLCTLTLALFFRMRRRAWVGTTAALFTPLVIWLGRNYLLGSGPVGEYSTLFQQAISIQYLKDLITNLGVFFPIFIPDNLFPFLASPSITSWLENYSLGFLLPTLGLVLMILVTLGYYQEIKNKTFLSTVIALYSATYLGILLILRSNLSSGDRYLSAILPFLLLFLFRGVEAITIYIPSIKNRSYLQTLLIGVTVFSMTFLYVIRDIYSVIRPHQQPPPDFSQGTDWLRLNTNPGSTVMASQSHLVYLYAQRKVKQFPLKVSNHENVDQIILCSNANYVLVQPEPVLGSPIHWDQITSRVQSALQRTGDFFKQAYVSPDGFSIVYEVQQPASIICP